jgi:superfamily II DNA or RNA helicase
LGGKFRAFSNAAAVIKQIKDIPKDLRTDEQKVMYQNACVFWGVMNRRKMFLYNLPEKISITKDIINMFPDRKSIVFSESIKFATKLQQSIGSTAVVYHSKMTKNQRVQTLKAFEIDESRVRTLCSVRALNVGLNVPEASLGIGASGNSKWLDQMQRNGRVARYAENKLAIYVNLYAYDTQEVKWVFSRTKKLNSDNVRWITKVDEIKF